MSLLGLSRKADDFVLGKRALPPLDLAAVGGEQDGCRLARDLQRPPRREPVVPQHLERGLVAGDEVFGLGQTVLGPKTDDGEISCVLSSKLLDPGRFGPAAGSVGCPEPDQEWFVWRWNRAQVDLGPGGDVVDHDGWQCALGWAGRLRCHGCQRTVTACRRGGRHRAGNTGRRVGRPRSHRRRAASASCGEHGQAQSDTERPQASRCRGDAGCVGCCFRLWGPRIEHDEKEPRAHPIPTYWSGPWVKARPGGPGTRSATVPGRGP